MAGGEWLAIEYDGAFRRNVGDDPSRIFDTVASSNMENSQIIRMIIMSTKT